MISKYTFWDLSSNNVPSIIVSNTRIASRIGPCDTARSSRYAILRHSMRYCPYIKKSSSSQQMSPTNNVCNQYLDDWHLLLINPFRLWPWRLQWASWWCWRRKRTILTMVMFSESSQIGKEPVELQEQVCDVVTVSSYPIFRLAKGSQGCNNEGTGTSTIIKREEIV